MEWRGFDEMKGREEGGDYEEEEWENREKDEEELMESREVEEKEEAI